MTFKSLLVLPAALALLSTCALADTMKGHTMKPHNMMGHTMMHSTVNTPKHHKHHKHHHAMGHTMGHAMPAHTHMMGGHMMKDSDMKGPAPKHHM